MTARFQAFFSAPGLDPERTVVVGFQLHEELSTPHRVEVELELADRAIDPSTWLLHDAQLVLADTVSGVVVRRVSGVVTQTRDRAGRARFHRLVVVLESPLARLRMLRDHRLFQEMTVRDIADTLLGEVGLADAVEWRLSGAPPTRVITTQFAERTLDFLSRLLEEEGIFYFAEHGEDGTRIVFGDAPSAFRALEASATLPYREDAGALSPGLAVSFIAERSMTRPSKVTLRDHDFERPSLDLTRTASDDAPLGREHYEYPTRAVDPAEGERRAKLRLEALQAAASGVEARFNGPGVTVGARFDLEGAPDPALDRGWIVASLRGGQKDGEAQATAWLVPDDLPFRPPVVTPRPVVRGPQLAVVTGPPGEEIHCDEHGRIKVHFLWDRRSTQDDKSSAWVRIAQMHTSGSVVIPRIGWEVVVAFEHGDPDRPLVLGRVYNARYQPPYPLPDQKTVTALQSKSTPGGGGQNEIRMQDSAGGEQMYVHAQKDLNLVVANNRTVKVTTTQSTGVGSNHTLDVGANETIDVGKARELQVGVDQDWTVGASRTKSVTSDETITVVGNRSSTIGGSHTVMTPKTVSQSTPASFSETVGGSCVEAAGLDVGFAVAGAASFTIGGAKIAACATGMGDLTVGAHAQTVGGAWIAATGADVSFSVGGAKATTVGGAWAANAGGDVEISSDGNITITVGGAVAFNGASIVLKVGGSNVTVASGGVAIKSSTIHLEATGPQPELAPMVEDK